MNECFQESRSEDETLETLCENVTELIRLLEEEGSKPLEPKGTSTNNPNDLGIGVLKGIFSLSNNALVTLFSLI